MDIGVDIWERETFRGALALGVKSLVALGYGPHQAARLANAFERHDLRVLEESRSLRGDDEAYVGFVRQSTELLDEVMRADRSERTANSDTDWTSTLRDIDKEAKARSD